MTATGWGISRRRGRGELGVALTEERLRWLDAADVSKLEERLASLRATKGWA